MCISCFFHIYSNAYCAQHLDYFRKINDGMVDENTFRCVLSYIENFHACHDKKCSLLVIIKKIVDLTLTVQDEELGKSLYVLI